VRLLNAVAHPHGGPTVAREDDLGVNHWPDRRLLRPLLLHRHAGRTDRVLRAILTTGPSRAVDYRIYSADADGRLPKTAAGASSTARSAWTTSPNCPRNTNLVVIGTGAGGIWANCFACRRAELPLQ